MSRTAGQFCGREQTYSLQADSPPPVPSTPMEPHKSANGEAMTWQQEQDFGTAVRKIKDKAVRFSKVDLDAVDDAHIALEICTGDPDFARQADVPSTKPFRQPRGKASVPPIRPAITTSSTGPPVEGTGAKIEITSEQPKKQTRRPRRKPSSVTNGTKDKKSAGMASTSPQLHNKAAALIPPHLRNKPTPAPVAAATQQKVDSCATNGSSTTSDKSKSLQPAEPESVPHRPAQPLTPPSSLPATLKELDLKEAEAEKAPEVQAPVQQASPEPTQSEGLILRGWDEPKPEPPRAAPRKSNKPRWPRAEPAPKKHFWPKNSEMRARSVSSSDGGISFKSNSDNDPNYDVNKLMSWNGDWLPPPEDWTARKGHTHRHFGSFVEKWIEGHDARCKDEIIYNKSTFHQDETCKELVPDYWLYDTIESKAIDDFWKEMATRTPAALNDVDMFADLPFWERLEDEVFDGKPSRFINGLTVPEARVNSEDPDNHDPRGDILASADYRMNLIQQSKVRNQRRTIQRQTRPLKESKSTGPPVEDRRIRPKSNVYFRPVQPTDVEGIAAIYNHYIETTIFANEFEERDVGHMSTRINNIIENGLPYLVAVARGNQPRGPQGYVSEKIVGFTYLDDFCDRSSMYRYTYELTLYVHPGYLCQNIGSCLLDRLLLIANTGYNACGGYEYRNDFNYLKTGTARVIKTILLNVNTESGEDSEKTNAFLKKFKFRCVGHVKEIGHKLGKIVDEYRYQHTTTEAIDAKGLPSMPLERVGV